MGAAARLFAPLLRRCRSGWRRPGARAPALCAQLGEAAIRWSKAGLPTHGGRPEPPRAGWRGCSGCAGRLCWTSKGAPLRAPRRCRPTTAPAAAAARRANATGVPSLPQIEAGGTAGRVARAKMHRLPSLTLLFVAWRQALSGAAGALIWHQPDAGAVGGHRHRHRRPLLAPDIIGQLHGRIHGRLSAPSSFLSCPLRQPVSQAAPGCKRLYVRRSAICRRGRARHYQHGLVRGRWHHRPTCSK